MNFIRLFVRYNSFDDIDHVIHLFDNMLREYVGPYLRALSSEQKSDSMNGLTKTLKHHQQNYQLYLDLFMLKKADLAECLFTDFNDEDFNFD